MTEDLSTAIEDCRAHQTPRAAAERLIGFCAGRGPAADPKFDPLPPMVGRRRVSIGNPLRIATMAVCWRRRRGASALVIECSHATGSAIRLRTYVFPTWTDPSDCAHATQGFTKLTLEGKASHRLEIAFDGKSNASRLEIEVVVFVGRDAHAKGVDCSLAIGDEAELRRLGIPVSSSHLPRRGARTSGSCW